MNKETDKFGGLPIYPYLCFMKNSVIKISKEQLRKIEKSHLRNEMLTTGFYSRPNHIVMKSEKTYTRKQKHKVSYSE